MFENPFSLVFALRIALCAREWDCDRSRSRPAHIAMAFAQRGAHSIAFHPRASLARCALKNAGVLYDVPVSNNGARVRLVARWKGIELTTTNPLDAFAGGLKSKAYEDVNPQVREG